MPHLLQILCINKLVFLINLILSIIEIIIIDLTRRTIYIKTNTSQYQNNQSHPLHQHQQLQNDINIIIKYIMIYIQWIFVREIVTQEIKLLLNNESVL